MDIMLSKKPRKRVANFTVHEKALLSKLIKERPIIESKLTDGKSVLKKKAAWNKITEDFNCHAHVHKRDTITLKRAWDNMKAVTRKARATERSILNRTRICPPDSPQPLQQEIFIQNIDEVAPVITCKVENSYDSDSSIINSLRSPSESNDLPLQNQDYVTDDKESQHKTVLKQIISSRQQSTTLDTLRQPKQTEQTSKPVNYMQREAVMRFKHLKMKNNIEIQILKAQLEAAEANKRAAEANERAAVIEEERSKIRLEVVKMEIREMEKTIGLK